MMTDIFLNKDNFRELGASNPTHRDHRIDSDTLMARARAARRVNQRLLRQVNFSLNGRTLLTTSLAANGVGLALALIFASGAVALAWGLAFALHSAVVVGVALYDRAIEAELAFEREQQRVEQERSRKRLLDIALEHADL